MSHKDRMIERYKSGNLPWDSVEPPPEVKAFVPSLPPGRALDLGCGHGRSAIFLARRGWKVDAVDFVELAIEEARRRAEEAGVQVQFHVGDITRLDFLSGPYNFAVDVGCAHGLQPDQLRLYHAELKRLLAPDAHFMLFARLVDQSDETTTDLDSLTDKGLKTLFADGFKVAASKLNAPDPDHGSPWPSGWYIFRRA